MRMDKDVIVNGAGCGVGVVQTILTQQYLGGIPGIESVIPYPWNQWGTLGNIIIGGFAFGFSQFTNIIKNYKIKNFLTYYGLVTLIGGLMNGIFITRTEAGAAYMGTPRGISPQTGRVTSVPLNEGIQAGNGFYTQKYYPGYTGKFYRRPETRAKGFGSDVTVNPKAAIPTTVPYDKILS